MKYILVLMAIILFSTQLWADVMPDFRLPDMSGENVSLTSLLGKGPILVDFWADYCQPCKVAMPYLHELTQKYEELTVVLISIDAPRVQMRAKNYLRSKDYDFVTLFDPEKTLSRRLNVSNPPHSFILDQEGNIIYSHVGFEPGVQDVYESYIRDLLDLDEEAEAEQPPFDTQDSEDCGAEQDEELR
jgi:cytochrome c biogenesis protein CcmG, thiol:disulfide interchange protein DsbE